MTERALPAIVQKAVDLETSERLERQAIRTERVKVETVSAELFDMTQDMIRKQIEKPSHAKPVYQMTREELEEAYRRANYELDSIRSDFTTAEVVADQKNFPYAIRYPIAVEDFAVQVTIKSSAYPYDSTDHKYDPHHLKTAIEYSPLYPEIEYHFTDEGAKIAGNRDGAITSSALQELKDLLVFIDEKVAAGEINPQNSGRLYVEMRGQKPATAPVS